jgi:hypothetical protein
VRARDNSRRRSFFFDPVETVYRRTVPVKIDVRPLPEADRPAGFEGAVGRFTVEARPDRREARTGEAISVVVKIRGEGNMRSITPPRPEPTTEFSVYPPRTLQAGSAPGDPGEEERAWEFILVPRRPGEQVLPSFAFSFFDPERGAYATVDAPGGRLSVSGDPLAEGEAIPALERQAIERLASDIHHIETPAAIPSPAGAPPYRSLLFWLGLAAPPLLNLGALLWRWRRHRAPARAGAHRRRRACPRALRRLARVRSRTLEPGNDDYREVAQILTDFVGDAFNQPAGGLTYDRMGDLLAQRAVPESAARALIEVLEASDYARFSRGAPRAEDRSTLVDRAMVAVKGLAPWLS